MLQEYRVLHTPHVSPAGTDSVSGTRTNFAAMQLSRAVSGVSSLVPWGFYSVCGAGPSDSQAIVFGGEASPQFVRLNKDAKPELQVL